ncbi:MAG TPA: hypothetical protein VG476_12625 [Acidimicrobiales bacterium]|nr:hypothetical protein [Acidimicrobiales bacterium]
MTIYEARLTWSEVGEVRYEEWEPTALTGSMHVRIEDEFGNELALLDVPVSGDPATLDGQLDAALWANGWERVSDINSWTDDQAGATTEPGHGACGRCDVKRKEDKID